MFASVGKGISANHSSGASTSARGSEADMAKLQINASHRRGGLRDRRLSFVPTPRALRNDPRAMLVATWSLN